MIIFLNDGHKALASISIIMKIEYKNLAKSPMSVSLLVIDLEPSSNPLKGAGAFRGGDSGSKGKWGTLRNASI